MTGHDAILDHEMECERAARQGYGISSKDAVRYRFLKLLSTAPVPLTASALSSLLGVPSESGWAEGVLTLLQERGQVVKDERGNWSIT